MSTETAKLDLDGATEKAVLFGEPLPKIEVRTMRHYCAECGDSWLHSDDPFDACCTDAEVPQVCGECALRHFPMSSAAEDRRALGL